MWRLSWTALRAISAINRWVDRRFTSAGLLLLGTAGAAAIIGVDTERAIAYQVFALLAAVVLVAFLATLRFRSAVAVERDASRYATVGEPFVYRLRLNAGTAGPERGLLVRDELADARPTLAAFLEESRRARSSPHWIERLSGFRRWQRMLRHRPLPGIDERPAPDLLPGRATEIAVEVVPRHRGEIRFEAITIARTDPFGIARARDRRRAPGTVLVLPRRYRLPPLSFPGARRFQHGGVTLASSIGDSEEFIGLRDYRPGDPLQRVHWKSFARVGHPVVREYQDEFFERHALVLDTFIRPGDEASFEEAVSVAASFASTVDTRECLLDLMFVGRVFHTFSAGRGQLSADRLLEVLAGAHAAPHTEFDALRTALRGARAGLASAIVVLVGWDDARAALVRDLRAGGLAVQAYCIVAPGDVVSAPGVRVLVAGRVQQGLLAA